MFVNLSIFFIMNFRLEKGVLGLLWEDLPRIVRPLKEVSEARKNILLYKIKNEPKDWLIQSVRNTVHIREERKKLDAKIKNAEEKWRQQEFLCRQKGNKFVRFVLDYFDFKFY